MTRPVIVQVELRGGAMTLGSVTRADSQHATVVPAGAPLKPNELPWTFELVNGRHITWGQGRHDVDEYPRLTPESLLLVKDSRR
jgi:hypothetical protein